MKKVILIPDSFKGTMSSIEICDIMYAAIKKHYPNCQITKIPLADGGEGSVDAFISALGGRKIQTTVCGPFGEPVSAFYGQIGNSAIIEMAAAAGLPLVKENRHPGKATTRGVGELIRMAVLDGAKELVVCLGGSATNDGGAGVAHECGVKFYNNHGIQFLPVGESLSQIERIDCSGLMPELNGIKIVTMCDIANPLCGENGATHVFAPQKGADPEELINLEQGMLHFADIVARDTGVAIRDLPGTGAAGGMGGGMHAFFHSQLKSGIDTLLDIVNFENILKDADLVFTGEGKFDSQSLQGKAVMGVVSRAAKMNVPVVAIVGDIGEGIEDAYSNGLRGIFSINRAAIPFAEAKKRAKKDLYLTMDNLLHYMKSSDARL